MSFVIMFISRKLNWILLMPWNIYIRIAYVYDDEKGYEYEVDTHAKR